MGGRCGTIGEVAEGKVWTSQDWVRLGLEVGCGGGRIPACSLPALQVAKIQKIELPVIFSMVDGVHILGEVGLAHTPFLLFLLLSPAPVPPLLLSSSCFTPPPYCLPSSCSSSSSPFPSSPSSSPLSLLLPFLFSFLPPPFLLLSSSPFPPFHSSSPSSPHCHTLWVPCPPASPIPRTHCTSSRQCNPL